MKPQLYRNNRLYIALLLGIWASDCLPTGKIIYNELDVKLRVHKYINHYLTAINAPSTDARNSKLDPLVG